MNFQDVYKKLVEDFNYLFSIKADSLKYDKTFRAKVIESLSTKKCKVLYKGKEYIAKCDGNIIVDDMVWVCAPGNDWNELYIQSYSYPKDSLPTSGVIGVKGNSETTYRTGNVNITAENIGLEKVNNTSDQDKPISIKQQTALNDKVSSSVFDLHKKADSKDHDSRYYTKNISNKYFKKFEIFTVEDDLDIIERGDFTEESYICNISGIGDNPIFIPIGNDAPNFTIDIIKTNGAEFRVRWFNHHEGSYGGLFTATFLVIYTPIDFV